MWGELVASATPLTANPGPQGVWVDRTTFALFWIEEVGIDDRTLWMQRFTRKGLKLESNGAAINLGAVPITAPNAASGGEMHVTVAPDGEVLISFAEVSVIFG